MGKAAKPALPAMLKILLDEELLWDRGTALIQVVTNLGPDAKDAAPAMLSIIRSMGEAKAEASKRGMGASWAQTDFEAARALAAMGPSVVPAIIEALSTGVWDVDYTVQLALKEMGKPALPGILAALEHENANVRANVAEVLGDMKIKSSEVREALERAARDPDATVRERALASLGGQDEAAIPTLIANLRAKETRLHALRALKRHGARAEAAIPELIELTRNKNSSIVELAAEALGSMGPRAADAVPAIVEAMSRVEGYTREPIADALGKIGAPAVPAILEAMGSTDSGIRVAAARALRGLREFDGITLRALQESLGTDDSKVRLQVALALAPRPIALPALIRGLSEPDYESQEQAAEAIAKYGPEGKSALPALFEAVRAMGQAYRANGNTFPHLMSWAHTEVTKTIRIVGPNNLPLLVAMLRDNDVWVQEAAEPALRRAGEAAVPHLQNAMAQCRRIHADAHPRCVTSQARLRDVSGGPSGPIGRHSHSRGARAPGGLQTRPSWPYRFCWRRSTPRGDLPQDAARVLLQFGPHAAFAEADIRRHLEHRNRGVPYYLRQLLAKIEAE